MTDPKMKRIYGENLDLLEEVKKTIPVERNDTNLINELLAEGAIARLESSSDPPQKGRAPSRNRPPVEADDDLFSNF